MQKKLFHMHRDKLYTSVSNICHSHGMALHVQRFPPLGPHIFYCLLKDEYRIRDASPWHKSKLAFMNFRALSQPSVDYLLSYFEGVCEQCDASVILTLLNVTLFFENGDQNAVSPGRWYALSGQDSVAKFAKCHHPQLSQAFPYLHWYLVAAHSLATLHQYQCSLSISASLTGLVIPWLGALSSVSTRGFSSFFSQLKYWPPSLSDVFIFHQHLSCCTFDGSNLSNVMSFSVPSHCDSVDVFLPFTRFHVIISVSLSSQVALSALL